MKIPILTVLFCLEWSHCAQQPYNYDNYNPSLYQQQQSYQPQRQYQPQPEQNQPQPEQYQPQNAAYQQQQSKVVHPAHYQEEEEKDYPPQPFSYEYGGADSSGRHFAKTESSDDDGVVRGENIRTLTL